MRGVLQTLNENAGAIQAIATAALLLITGWYARLTYRLVKVQEAVQRERTAELRSVVLTIRQGLLQLPTDTATAAAKMREAAIWDVDDLPTLRALASWFSSDAGDHAARALAPLRWLGEQARESKRAGFDWERFPWNKYREELAIAQYHVVALWGAASLRPLSHPRPLVPQRALDDGRPGTETYVVRSLTVPLALLTCAVAPARPQQPVDTTVTLQGFLQQDNEVRLWTIVVPLPLEVLGTRTYVVPLSGKPERWSRFLNRYIEASGRVMRLPDGGTPGVGMEVERAKFVDPPGTTRATIDHGMTLQANITLSVVPNRFAWRDSTRSPTGVNPLLLYTILNRRATPIFFVPTANRFLCVTFRSAEGIRIWDTTTSVPSPDARRYTMQGGGLFRGAVHFPEAAASRPGHYYARVGVCDVDDYNITAEFDVR